MVFGSTVRQNNPSLEELFRDSQFKLSDRLLVLRTWYSHTRGGIFTMGHRKQCEILGCTEEELRGAIEKVNRRRDTCGRPLFVYNRQAKRYDRSYLPGETPKKFEARVRSCRGTRSDMRTAWSLMHIQASGVAPHSVRQFAQELGMHAVTASRCLKAAAAAGRTRRFGGNGRIKCRYVHPETVTLHSALDGRYGKHQESSPLKSTRMQLRWEERRCREESLKAANQQSVAGESVAKIEGSSLAKMGGSIVAKAGGAGGLKTSKIGGTYNKAKDNRLIRGLTSSLTRPTPSGRRGSVEGGGQEGKGESSPSFISFAEEPAGAFMESVKWARRK